MRHPVPPLRRSARRSRRRRSRPRRMPRQRSTFAADEACLTHRPLHLLHVLRVSGAEAYAAVYDGAFEAADAGADAGRCAVARERVAGRVPVTAERVDDGWLVADLVHRAERADLLVLQHRRLSRWHRLVTGSTVERRRRRARVPVVSVPEDWTSRRGRPPSSRSASRTPSRRGRSCARRCRAARERDARVEVLHAWWLNGGYDSVVNDPEFRAEQEREAVAHASAPALEAARRGLPGRAGDRRRRVTRRRRGLCSTRPSTRSCSCSVAATTGLPFGTHLGPGRPRGAARRRRAGADAPRRAAGDRRRGGRRSTYARRARLRLRDVGTKGPGRG